MPTKRKRYTITEVGPVAEALELVRAEVGEPLDLPELVRLGAERKLEIVRAEGRSDSRRRELRERLISRSTRPGSVDLDAAAEVRRRGFSRELDG